MKLHLLIIFLLSPILLYSESCYESMITKPNPFMGNDGEIFQLENGTIGEVKYEYEYMYEYYPNIVICPNDNIMIIKDKRLNIKLHKANIKSKIDGEFNGLEGETIIKLINGQIWQQSEYHYQYIYKYMPEVLIYKSNNTYKMKIEGIDKSIRATRLK